MSQQGLSKTAGSRPLLLENLEARNLLAPVVPGYNSDPNAPVDLYLDFDGHFEAVWGSYADLTTPVYDIDGDSDSFNQTELDIIEEVWLRVSEDFIPFNINVTTVEPPELAPGVPESEANGKALRLSVGETWGSTAGGLAYIDAFTNSTANVAYVFTVNRGGNAYSLAETTSHEAGHGFGLHHQSLYDPNSGEKLEEYNPGDGNWAPLMGGGSPKLSTWNYGPDNQGPTSIVDEMAVLARPANVFGFRADDHGNTSGTATALSYNAGTWSENGLIGQNDDVDVFSFTNSVAQRVALTVDVAPYGPNLDAVLELRDSSNNVVETADPQNSLGARVVEQLGAGDYTLYVSNVDQYGWIGQYSIEGVVVSPGPYVDSSSHSGLIYDSSVSSIRITFDDPVDPATFDATDVSLVGPLGAVTVSGVNAVAGSGDRQFDILFAAQSRTGAYDLSVGVDPANLILDPAGNKMNQDQDGTTGETNEDEFQNSFSLVGNHPGWSFNVGGIASDQAYNVLTDAGDNIYVHGRFKGTADFDPGPATSLLGSTGGYDSVLAKYSPDRQLLWATRFGGEADEIPRDLAIDDSGAVYATGEFKSTSADFGAFTLATAGLNDAYLAKFDGSTGQVLWAHGYGSSAADTGQNVVVDSLGRVHLSGKFQNTVDFDPGSGTSEITSAGSTDGYIATYDASGSFLAIQRFGGPDIDSAPRLAADGQGNLLGTGRFRGTADFGQRPDSTPVSLTSTNGTFDIYVLKLNSAGETLWTFQSLAQGDTSAWRVGVDTNDNVYHAAGFTESVSFGGGTPTLSSQGDSDAYVTKLDSSGSQLWVRQIAGDSKIFTEKTAIDDAGNLYVSGYFKGTADFDPGPQSLMLRSAGGEDGFVLRLDSSGEFDWVHQIQATASTRAGGIALDSSGNVFTAGRFTTEVATPTGDSMSSVAGQDMLILKLSQSPGMSVFPTTGLETSEDGAVAQFSVVLEQAPTADVTIPISSSDVTEGTVTAASLTFTVANWRTPQTVTINPVDDGAVDGDASFTVQLGAASSSDANYDGMDPTDVAVTNLDNDVPQDILYFSLTSSGSPGNVSADNEDILSFNGTGFSMIFDGSDVGVGGFALDAFDIIGSSEILMSFTGAGSIPGISGTVDDSDILKFTASQLGDVTAGTFSLFFDGSDAGLTSGGEDVDGIAWLDNNQLLISTSGSFSVSGLSGADEDIALFTATSVGSNTSGTWTAYFDGSDVGLSSSSSEDVDAVGMDSSGRIYLSTRGSFGVTGVSGADEDVFVFTPSSLGANTSGTFDGALFFDGSAHGLSGQDIGGIDLPSGPPEPDLSVDDATVTEGSTGTINATFTVTLSSTSQQAVTVNYSTADVLATAGSDYVAGSGQLVIPAGQTTGTITIAVAGDLIDEVDETFLLNLSNAVGAAIVDGQGTGTIIDDDVAPTISIDDVTVAEGDSGSVNAAFTVTLSSSSGKTVSVSYATADGDAVAGFDYTARSGTLSFGPGETNQTVTVQITGDTVDEFDETLFLNLSNPGNGTLADGQGQGTVTDDDVAPSLWIDDVSISEGQNGTVNAVFAVSLSAASGKAISVDYVTADETATAGSDYTAVDGMLSFSPGQTSNTVSVPVFSDTAIEGNETFQVNLASPINATLGDDQGLGTIIDDDLPTLSIDDVSVSEGDSPTTTVATFTITLSAAHPIAPVSVDFLTADGTANAAQGDYQATGGTLTFLAGTTDLTRTVVVSVTGDALYEVDETFLVNLTGAVNANLANGQGVGTIVDDDSAPSMAVGDVTILEGANAVFTLSLSSAAGRPVSVDFATADGAGEIGANQPADYQAAMGTATFDPGQTAHSVTVTIQQDALDEWDELLYLNLSNAVPAAVTIADSQAAATVTDDDSTPQLTINDVSVGEGNSGTADAGFAVGLSSVSGRTITVDYATTDVTAIAGSDYVSTAGTLTFIPGQINQPVTVSVLSDIVEEEDETFLVNLTSPSAATLGDGQGLATIVDDDSAGPKLFTRVVTSTSDWQTVATGESYSSMVVVATPNYSSTDAPAVVRIQNASGGSFQFFVQNVNNGAAVGGVPVHFMVIEEGVYSVVTDGVKMEAHKFNSDVTDHAASWVATSRSYSNSYTSPVVLGQVMTYNDPKWSAFWSRSGSSRSNVPDSTLKVGKQVAEDSTTTRLDETVGYIVIEAGGGEISGNAFVAGLGDDSIKGVGDSPSYNYSVSGLNATSVALISQSAMDGGNGGWAVLYGSNPVSTAGSTTTLKLAVDEDQIKDSERRHTHEQVAYVVFEDTDLLASQVSSDRLSGGHLTMLNLAPIVEQAIEVWAASGLTPAAIELLRSADVHITDLPGTQLGSINGTGIWLDRDAAGHGWSIDDTERVDPMNVVLHELGHILGYGHVFDRPHVMNPELPIGTRPARRPTTDLHELVPAILHRIDVSHLDDEITRISARRDIMRLHGVLAPIPGSSGLSGSVAAIPHGDSPSALDAVAPRELAVDQAEFESVVATRIGDTNLNWRQFVRASEDVFSLREPDQFEMAIDELLGLSIGD